VLGAIVKNDILEHESVQAWRSQHPREWWAFQQLGEHDDLRTKVLAAVLGGRLKDEAISGLVRFAEALETRLRAERDGTVEAPPADGERRSVQISVSRMEQMSDERGRKFFRVDFTTAHGWSGWFDTTNPDVVERIAKRRDRSPIMVVGEVVRRPHEFLVELGERVRIV
jgi:hypothetical protein